jgi:hypothetical protein
MKFEEGSQIKEYGMGWTYKLSWTKQGRFLFGKRLGKCHVEDHKKTRE